MRKLTPSDMLVDDNRKIALSNLWNYLRASTPGKEPETKPGSTKLADPEVDTFKYAETILQRRAERKNEVHEECRKRIDEILNADEKIKERLFHKLGFEFTDAAQRGDTLMVEAFLEEGFPINYQEFDTGLCALHLVAGSGARNTLRTLLKNDDIDFLLRDEKGRLASEFAFLHGRDPGMARLLAIKERKQANAEGVKLTRRPKE